MKTSSTIIHSANDKRGISKIHIHENNEDYYFGDDHADLRAKITVVDSRAYRRILLGGSIGAAEAYVEDLWRTNNLTNVIRILDALLQPGGKLLIQAITIPDQRYDQYRGTVDFIQRYIFPGGHLPSVSEILKHIKEQTSMRLNHFADYSLHYADTLNEWNQRFLNKREEIMSLGFSEDFCRLWQYYFCYSEGGFREAAIGLAHIETVKQAY